eukprot:comp20126_c0_seq1/m.24846 comp20126_c0_seq1/g.24846  ORF comp20126_c0_seq1/g.24846 comp20126_c0_seq1/m.24846 type:complete len:641 (-) comp20126_c0_seq1:400-2322(-)
MSFSTYSFFSFQGPTTDWSGQTIDEDEENEDEEGEYSEFRSSTRDMCVLMVDSSPEMFVAGEGGLSSMQMALSCIKNMYTNKIITNPNDLLALAFFNTGQSKNEQGFPHVVVAQELAQLGAKRIEEVEHMEGADAQDCRDRFDKEYGIASAGSATINDVIWVAQHMLSQAPSKTGLRRIFLFTCHDNPHASDPGTRMQAIQRARDASSVGCKIELLHMNPPDGTFDVDAFYKDVMEMTDEEVGALSLPDPATRLEDLKERLRIKQYTKRTMARLPWKLGEGLEIGVGVYKLISEAKRNPFVWLERETNAELKLVTRNICPTTGAALTAHDLAKGYEYGGEMVHFEADEARQIKQSDIPGLVLLGFKPIDRLKIYHNIRTNDFIYPDETVIQGSTQPFAALHRQCLSLGRAPVCRILTRPNSTLRIAFLLPQPEEKDESGFQIRPPGFHAIYLPYANDLRKLKYPLIGESRATEGDIELMKQVVRKLELKDFDLTAFCNPVIQKHYASLEALALQRDEEEGFEDTTQPDTAAMDKRVEGGVKQFVAEVYPEGYDPEAAAAGPKKRKAPASSGGSRAKKAATEKGAEGGDDITALVKSHHMQGTLGKLTMPQLKDYLGLVGQKVGGKKQELVDRVAAYLDAR